MADEADDCPLAREKTAVGACGCGVADTDIDSDGTLDCNDACDADPHKNATGECGCRVADSDLNQNEKVDRTESDGLKSVLSDLRLRNPKRELQAFNKEAKGVLSYLRAFKGNAADREVKRQSRKAGKRIRQIRGIIQFVIRDLAERRNYRPSPHRQKKVQDVFSPLSRTVASQI